MLTQAIEDYLKVIYKLHQAGEAVTTNAIAQRLNVAPASASNMIKKLARLQPGVTVEVVDVAADGSIRLRTARAGLQVSFDQARAVYVALEPAAVSRPAL